MGKNRRRRRPERRRTARPEYSRAGDTSTASRPTTIGDLNDDLLDLVLLRISSPFCLVRAAATCKLWRCAIAGAAFLRRFRSLHGRHVLGHYYVGDKILFIPCPVPPGEVPAIDDVRSRASLHFLRSQSRRLADSRGGLLTFVEFSNIVVCDPWTRQQREVHCWFPWVNGIISRSTHIYGAFLLDADDDEPAHIGNFRVLCVHVVEDYGFEAGEIKTAGASVYSAKDRSWRLLSSTAIVGDNLMTKLLVRHRGFIFVGRGGGSLCWSVKDNNNVLHVDESTGEFSAFTLPPADVNGYGRRNLRVVSTRRIVSIVGDALEVLTLTRGCTKCVVENRYKLSQLANVQASPEWSWFFLDTARPPGKS
ncbi:hypothetical protein EJB05_00796, partial [Eragrostis curvula]